MSHLHSIYDTDLHFIIDPIKRSITSESGKVSLMQYDHNSERFTFEVPRFIEGHDMSQSTSMEIHYVNIDGSNKHTQNADIYIVDDLQVSPDSEDVVIGSWLISHNATTYAGTLNFIVRFVCYTEEEIIYQWFSDVHPGIKITKGIYNSEVLPSQFDVDILESWKRDVIQAFKDSDVYADTERFRDESNTSALNAAASAAHAKRSEEITTELIEEIKEDLEEGVYNGMDGAPGAKGEKGDPGPVGPVGPMGPQGETGPQGPQGLRGRDGATGATGATGPQGVQGIRGAQGERGPAGPTGPTGPAGPEGPQGPPGESGVMAPISGFFTLTVDADGNFYAVSNSEDTPMNFEYDEETGNLYLLQEE